MKDYTGDMEQKILKKFERECLAITLTYRPEDAPLSESSAKLQLRQFVERCQKRYRRRGLPFCAVSGTGLHGRIHHHLICSLGMEPKELQEAWDKGLVWAKPVPVDVRKAMEMALHLAANH